MSAIAFTVPGDPMGKGRPRIIKIGGFSRMTADKKSASYEGLVALAAERAMAGRIPFECPVSMTVTARLVPAASTSAKLRAAMLAGAMPPTKKPDLDNIGKIIGDACNKITYRDDALIVQMTLSKIYAEVAGVDVTIAPYAADKQIVRRRWVA